MTDINNPSVPENILIPITSDSTKSNMGNFSNATLAIPPNNAEANQSTLNTQNTTTDYDQDELNTVNTVMPYTNNQVK